MARQQLNNGNNLNSLCAREPGVYGNTNPADVENHLTKLANGSGHKRDCFHGNAEQEIVDRVQPAPSGQEDFILLSPGAFKHARIALRDALLAVSVPFIEIRLSNLFAREDFRHKSNFSGIAQGCIVTPAHMRCDIA